MWGVGVKVWETSESLHEEYFDSVPRKCKPALENLWIKGFLPIQTYNPVCYRKARFDDR